MPLPPDAVPLKGPGLPADAVPLGGQPDDLQEQMLGIAGAPFTANDVARAGRLPGYPVEKVPATLGGFAGGLTGAKAGSALGPWGGVLGGLIGAGVGAGGTQAGYRLLRRAMGAEAPEAPPILPEATQVGFAGMTGQAMGGAAGAIAARGLAPFAKFMTPADIARMGQAASFGVPYGAVESSQAVPVTRLASLAERSVVGGERMREHGRAMNEGLRSAYERIVGGLGGPAAAGEAGTAAREAAPGVLSGIKTVGRGKYQAMEQAAADIPVTVNLTRLKGYAQDVQDALAEGLPPAQKAILDRVTNAVQKLGVRTTPETEISMRGGVWREPATRTEVPVNFNELLAVERDLNEILPQLRGMATRYSTGRLEGLAHEVDRSLTQAARGTAVEPLREEAKTFWRENVVPFRQQVARPLKAAPTADTALDLLVQRGRPERLQTFMQHMPSESRQLVGREWATRALERSTDPQTGLLRPRRLLSEWNNLGPDVQASLFPQDYQRIGQFMDVLGGAQAAERYAANPSGTGGALIQAGQIYNLFKIPFSLATGRPAQAAIQGISVGSPGLLAKILTSPGGTRWLSTGYRMPPMLRRIFELGGQVGAQSTLGPQSTEQR